MSNPKVKPLALAVALDALGAQILRNFVEREAFHNQQRRANWPKKLF